MTDLTIRQGETLTVDVETDRTDAVTVKMEIATTPTMLEDTATFVDLKAQIKFSATETNVPVGEYDYMLTIEYVNGDIEKLPDANCLDGSGELPKVNVLKSIGTS